MKCCVCHKESEKIMHEDCKKKLIDSINEQDLFGFKKKLKEKQNMEDKMEKIDKDYTVLKEWKTFAGFQAVVLRVRLGHHCGYVGITKKHPLYGKSYSQHCDCLMKLRDEIKKQPIGKRGIIPVFCWDGEKASMDVIFNVHGGVTYSGSGNDYPIKSKLYWIGFDCAHARDTPLKCNLDHCIRECERLAQQLKPIKNISKTKKNEMKPKIKFLKQLDKLHKDSSKKKPKLRSSVTTTK